MVTDILKSKINSKQYVWLVTGCAGFIGSHIAEKLISLNQKVVGLDNLSTGFRKNIDRLLSLNQNKQFSFIEGDIRSFETCQKVVKDTDIILHQAALGSVPRSIENPVLTNEVNVGGFLNIITAAKEAKVKKFVFASSSSVYGDNKDDIKVEERIGAPLSPYAISKKVNELYAANFSSIYGISTIGLRYFNVFGPYQDPNGAYAAVIPRWINKLLSGEQCTIYGDGKTSRDFCFVDNVVKANILAGLADNISSGVFNIACGKSTSLSQLYSMIRDAIADKLCPQIKTLAPQMVDFRVGDIRHSLASYDKAKHLLEYNPDVFIEEGIKKTVSQYLFKDSL